MLTDDGWESEIGQALRKRRLQDNLSQKAFAAKAGIGLNTLMKLEAGGGSSLRTFIRVLRALRKTDVFEGLEPERLATFEEFQRFNGAARQRASKGQLP